MFAIPITWEQFVKDMKEKWRYQYGDPAVREDLWRAQAQFYRAQADKLIPAQAEYTYQLARLGIPSEADYRRALAYKTYADVEMSKIDPTLVSQFLRLLAPLFPSNYPSYTTPTIATAIPSLGFNEPQHIANRTIISPTGQISLQPSSTWNNSTNSTLTTTPTTALPTESTLSKILKTISQPIEWLRSYFK